MIEHVSLPVKEYEKAKVFYKAVLRPLKYKLHMDFPPEAAGFMEGGHTSFWIVKKPVAEMHVAFLAKNKKQVHDFYEAAMKAGAKDNGPPGPRPDYSRDYYAAFVYDPDGHNIEAVCYVQPKRATKTKKKKK